MRWTFHKQFHSICLLFFKNVFIGLTLLICLNSTGKKLSLLIRQFWDASNPVETSSNWISNGSKCICLNPYLFKSISVGRTTSPRIENFKFRALPGTEKLNVSWNRPILFALVRLSESCNIWIYWFITKHFISDNNLKMILLYVCNGLLSRFLEKDWEWIVLQNQYWRVEERNLFSWCRCYVIQFQMYVLIERKFFQCQSGRCWI